MPKTLFQFFLYFIRQQKWRFIAIQLLCLAWAADNTAWPWLMGRVVDGLNLVADDRAHMWAVLMPTILLSFGIWITVDLGFRIGGLLMSRFLPNMENSVRTVMFDYIQQHSHRYFSDHFAGSLSNKIGDMTSSLHNLMSQWLTIFVPGAVAMLIALGMFIHLSSFFGLILGAWLLLHFSTCFGFARYCSERSANHAEARSVLAGKIVDVFSNIAAVRSFARGRAEKKYLAIYQKIEKKANKRSLMAIENVKWILSILSLFVNYIGINGYALYAWQHEIISIGEFVLVFNTTWNMTMVAWYLGLEFTNFFKDLGVCRQAFEPLQAPHEIQDAPGVKVLKVTKGEIIFDNVHFHYGKYRLFENKTVTIHAGKKIGLVGFSGSGKTTFVNLILRYFDVAKGQILIDGQNIAQVTQDSLHEQIALIPQDPSLFHRSLMDNIRYGRIDASDEEVMTAAKAAHCDEFIEHLSEKYNTLVGERGIKLSGGQRQRIAMARAILKNAPILILDEATSALDSATEKLIQDSLEVLMQGRTTLVIAHRLSTLSHMDEVLVFHQGEIIEQGSHEELLAQDGHYAMLWRLQAGGFLLDEATT